LPVSLDCPFFIADSVFASFSRETGKDRNSNQKWTIQRNWQRPNQQSKMDNPEKQAKTESAIKYGQYRETGKDRISNQKWTIQRNWQRPQSKMDNPEKLAKTESAIKNGQSRETGKDRISNQKWTIQRN
jgi:hypothetical protein